MKQKDNSSIIVLDDTDIVLGDADVPVVVTRIKVESKEEKKQGNIPWKHIGIALVIVALFIGWIASDQYNQMEQRQLSGSYTISRGASIDGDHLETPIDESYSLRILLLSDTGNSDNVLAIISLMPRTKGYSNSLETYEIGYITLKGKETKRLEVNERLVPEVNIFAVLNASTRSLGHTLEFEMSVIKTNTSTKVFNVFPYRASFLRESNGKIYEIKEGKNSFKQEPGFEGLIAAIAIITIVAAVRRKKE